MTSVDWGYVSLIVAAVFWLVSLISPFFIAGKSRRMTRLPFALRNLAIILVATPGIVLYALSYFGFIAGAYRDGFYGMLIGFTVINVVGFFGLLWSIYRLQDIGWGRSRLALLFVPGVGQVFLLLLLIWPSRKDTPTTVLEASA